jgi:hypothetical protein
MFEDTGRARHVRAEESVEHDEKGLVLFPFGQKRLFLVQTPLVPPLHDPVKDIFRKDL